jgi:hypothetical protein
VAIAVLRVPIQPRWVSRPDLLVRRSERSLGRGRELAGVRIDGIGDLLELASLIA